MFLNKSLPVSIALIHFVQRALAGFLVVTPESEEGLLNVNIIIKLITDNQSHGDEPGPPMWHETYRHCDQVTVCHGLSTILCTSLISWSSPWELISWLPVSGLPQTCHFRHQSESECWTRKNSRFLDLIMQTILLVVSLPFTLPKDLEQGELGLVGMSVESRITPSVPFCLLLTHKAHLRPEAGCCIGCESLTAASQC